MLANCVPIGIASILVIIGTAIKFGGGSTLSLLATLLLGGYGISKLEKRESKKKYL